MVGDAIEIPEAAAYMPVPWDSADDGRRETVCKKSSIIVGDKMNKGD